MKTRQTFVCYVIAGVAVSSILVAGYLSRDRILLEWHIWSLSSPNAGRRKQAAANIALFRREGALAIPALASTLSDENEEVASAAAGALISIGEPAVPQLAVTLEHGPTPAKIFSLIVLGQLDKGAEGAVPAIRQLVDNEDLAVRTLAAKLLSRLDGRTMSRPRRGSHERSATAGSP